jgi:hypothetical protein
VCHALSSAPSPSVELTLDARARLRTGLPAGARGTRHPRAHAAPPPRRRPGLLHPPGTQRPDRGHQRPPRSAAPQRPRLPQPDQLPHPLPTAVQRRQRAMLPPALGLPEQAGRGGKREAADDHQPRVCGVQNHARAYDQGFTPRIRTRSDRRGPVDLEASGMDAVRQCELQKAITARSRSAICSACS